LLEEDVEALQVDLSWLVDATVHRRAVLGQVVVAVADVLVGVMLARAQQQQRAQVHRQAEEHAKGEFVV
jgi:hypothetical protein